MQTSVWRSKLGLSGSSSASRKWSACEKVIIGFFALQCSDRMGPLACPDNLISRFPEEDRTPHCAAGITGCILPARLLICVSICVMLHQATTHTDTHPSTVVVITVITMAEMVLEGCYSVHPCLHLPDSHSNPPCRQLQLLFLRCWESLYLCALYKHSRDDGCQRSLEDITVCNGFMKQLVHVRY